MPRAPSGPQRGTRWLSVRVSEAFLERLRALARREHRSVSGEALEALERYVRQREREGEAEDAR